MSPWSWGPAGAGGGHHPGSGRPRRGAVRQGPVPPGQVLRRRAHDGRPPPARAPRAATRRVAVLATGPDAAVAGPFGPDRAVPAAAHRRHLRSRRPPVDLDAALLDVARTAGARCSTATVSPTPLRVRGPRPARGRPPRAARAGYAIGADGMWSTLRKAFVAPEAHPLPRRVARLRQYFTRRPRRRAAVGLVRARPAAGLRLVLPPPGGRGECGLRHPPGPGPVRPAL